MSEIKILLMILTLTSVHPLVLIWLMISIRKNRILRLIISHFTGSSGKNKISRKEDQQDFQQFEVRRGENSMRKTGLGWQSTKLLRSRERFLSCWTLSRLVGCNIDCLVAAVSFDRYKARLISKKKRKKKKENSLMFLTNDAVSSTYARDENHGTLIGPFPIRYN